MNNPRQVNGGAYTTSYNPANGSVIGTTPLDSPEALNTAVAEARDAQAAWAALSFSERKKALLRVSSVITEQAETIADVIAKSTGKPRVDAMAAEVVPAAFAFKYYAANARRVLKRRHLAPGHILFAFKHSYIDRVPYGVIGIISPWNYPFGIPMHEIGMALAAGNAVVLKVASQTLEVGRVIKELLQAAGLPQGLFSLLNLPGVTAGPAFINSGINKLFFTGSVAVGKELTRLAADTLLPLSLELGGNDPMIVLDDADVSRAVGGALWAGYANTGQSCAGVERVYVHEAIYDRFVSLLKERLGKLRVGEDTDFSVDIGSLTTQGQLATVQAHVQDAAAKGALVFLGNTPAGQTGAGYFHQPVILENVTMDMLTMREETFGPVLAIDRFSTDDEAVAKANNSNLGLTASVWGSNKKRAHALAARLEHGAVMINDHLMSHGLPETPWGGFKQSGTGRTHSYLGMQAMTQPRVVIDDLLPLVAKNMWWHPYSKSVYNGMLGIIQMLFSPNLNTRFNGAIAFIKTFARTFNRSFR